MTSRRANEASRRPSSYHCPSPAEDGRRRYRSGSIQRSLAAPTDMSSRALLADEAFVSPDPRLIAGDLDLTLAHKLFGGGSVADAAMHIRRGRCESAIEVEQSKSGVA